LSRELNFNIMFSQRGVISLAHSEHELEINRRWANATRMSGVDSQILESRVLQSTFHAALVYRKLLWQPITVNGFDARRARIRVSPNAADSPSAEDQNSPFWRQRAT
jgi:hypothetical protein